MQNVQSSGSPGTSLKTSGLNGCKEAVIQVFPLHFLLFLLLFVILMFVNTLFLYKNVCIVHYHINSFPASIFKKSCQPPPAFLMIFT